MAGEVPNVHYRSLPRKWRYNPKRIPQLGRLPTQPSWGLLPGPRGDPARPCSNQPVGPEFPKGNGRPAAGSQALGRRTCPNTPCGVSAPARMASRSRATKARSWRSISWRTAIASAGIGSSSTSLLRKVWLATPVPEEVMRAGPADRGQHRRCRAVPVPHASTYLLTKGRPELGPSLSPLWLENSCLCGSHGYADRAVKGGLRCTFVC